MLSVLDDLDADVEAAKPIHWTVGSFWPHTSQMNAQAAQSMLVQVLC